MGNRFNQNLHHTNATNGIFLPMFCSRSSIKDAGPVTSTSWPRHHPKDTPASPKVSCIGQVKNNLRNGNKVAGFPASPYKLTDRSFVPKSNSVRYGKLKRLFSGKYLATPSITTSMPNTNRTTRPTTCHAKNYRCNPSTVPVDILLLDPPIPVIIKKAEQRPERENNLWKRRSCGAALKGLQVEKVHGPCITKNYVQPTTV